MHKPVDFSLNSLEVVFSPSQLNHTSSRIIDLIEEKHQAKQHFYGIEVSSSSQNPLNYSSFYPILPLFTSIVWIGKFFSSIDPINEVPAVECAKKLQQHTTVVPHLTCYNLSSNRLDEFLQLNMSNVLVLRGDQVAEQQTYRNAVDLVKEIKTRKKDSISIGVGGYPDTHPDSASKSADLKYLKQKVDAGADFIITQFTFSITNLLNFIRDCRQIGINVPIIPGILVPENMRSLRFASVIARVDVPQELMNSFEKLENDEEGFKNFSVEYFKKFVKEIFNSDLEIYGVQFFTLNRFDAVQRVIKECF
ncbi:hypothetical protein ACFFRR_001703 [Megaselia abdita]